MHKKYRKAKIYKKPKKKRKNKLYINTIIYPKIIRLIIIIFLFLLFLYNSTNTIHIAINLDNNYIYPCIVF